MRMYDPRETPVGGIVVYIIVYIEVRLGDCPTMGIKALLLSGRDSVSL